MNINKIFNDIAIEQGIEPGTYLWNLGGTKAYSGTTGGHSSYGWKHDHKLISYGVEWIKAVIANYGHRRCFYLDEPIRKLTYEDAGRPAFYVPELIGDQLNGSTNYWTSNGLVNVTGPDIQHFQIGTLIAVYDNPDNILIKCQGNMVSAKLVAGQLIRYLMKSLAGMCMKTPTQVNDYFYNDRGAACIMHATEQAFKRDLIDWEDLMKIKDYIEKTILPRYEGPQPLQESDKPTVGVTPEVTGNKFAFHQLYNGLYWTLPVMYDLWKLIPPSTLKNRFDAIVKRHSQYILDLELLMPGKGVSMAGVSFPDSIMKGIDGKAVPNWKDLTVSNCHFNDSDWSLWGYRAQKTAAKVLNSAVLEKSSTLLLEKLKANLNDPETKGWLVDSENVYSTTKVTSV